MNESARPEDRPEGRSQGPAPTTSTSDLLELEIGPVAHGGWCVARHEGKVVFVRHALPGELVRARVVEETARLVRADAIEILRGSPDRVAPPCPYAGPGRCGGCDWQHATLAAQRELKAAVVKEQLRRIAGLEVEVTVEALPSPVPDEDPSGDSGLGWRTRVRFAVSDDGVVGFRRHRSHEIEPVDACVITHPEIERLGIERHRWPGADQIEVAASAATGDRVVAVPDRNRGAVEVPRLAAPVRLVRGEPQPGPGLPYVREHAAGRTWQVSGTGFWQVHPAAADTLVEAVLEALEPRSGERVLDLYCGVGLFVGALAERVGPAGTLTGVEEDPIAVRDARHNLRDLPNVTIERGRVERVLSRGRPARGGGPGANRDRPGLDQVDLVVLDPPRSGAGQTVVRRVAALARRRIAYVSCDPATLARDLRYFAEHGWSLAGLRAFDAFPMTHHVECVAILEPVKKDGA
ncbi:class I SAM-dependent RNA methyltransferase [Actinopolymorpha alba]|uniref:class I SAM-dependent RNA methyltransferase n=1 Tax=Actinopolymorpha alba TaxID=533267 RepID=UPI00035FE35E|nr:class I SAM-dependent RNA methyltransferase [Actinopolymorpha alba]